MKFIPLLLLLASASVFAQETELAVQLDASATGTPNVYELTWSSPDATQCQATGDWSGPRAFAGVETVTVTGTMTFGMSCVGGEQSTLSWTPPTERVDNTPLSPTDLAGFGVFAGYTQTTLERITTVNDPTVTSYVIEETQEGPRYYAVTAIDTEGLESDLSSIATKTVLFPTGQAADIVLTQTATELRIVGTTVYTVVKRVDRFLLLPVGSAPAGTVCIESQQVNGYYVVPRAVVTWSGTIKPDVVVAQCAMQ